MGRERRIADIQPFAELARGPATVVYKGYQPALDRFVLLKVLRPGFNHDEALANRFEAEARLVAQVQHPNVVHVHAYGRDGDHVYLAAEFVDGVDLRMVIASGPVPPEVAAFVVLEAARGLQAAHNHGILHRDLKPSNILIAYDGHVKLTDFGMASLIEAEDEPEVRGTPAYLAPELVHGEPPTPASDLFSLGATLYEALAGRAPFVGSQVSDLLDAVLHHDPLPTLRRFIHLPENLYVICERLLDKDPSRRYASAKALVDDLESFLATCGLAAGTEVLQTYLDAPGAYQPAPVPDSDLAAPQAVREDGASSPSEPMGNGRRMEVVLAVLSLLLAVGIGGGLLWRGNQTDDPPAASAVEEAERLPAPSTVPEDSSVSQGEERAGAEEHIDSVATGEPPLVDDAAGASPFDSLAETEDRPAELAGTPLPQVPDSMQTEEEPEADPGRLLVEVVPWADVFVDGALKGRTPLGEPFGLEAGTYLVTLKHPEFPEYNTEVEIGPGAENVLQISLYTLVGRLWLDARPWAVVLVDGAVRDTTPVAPLILSPGVRRLMLRRNGVGSWDTTMTVRAGTADTLLIRWADS